MITTLIGGLADVFREVASLVNTVIGQDGVFGVINTLSSNVF